MTNPSSQSALKSNVRKMQEASSNIEEVSLRPVIRFLEETLSNKSRGIESNYDILVQQLTARDDPDTVLRLYIGLSACVPLISQSSDTFMELKNALFTYKFDMDERLSQAFVRLLLQLTSANSSNIKPVFYLLIEALLLVDVEGDYTPTLSKRCLLLHRAIFAVLHIVPGSSNKLFHIISKRPLHHRAHENILQNYVNQLLIMVDYLPIYEKNIINMVVSKLLEIDVEILIENSNDILHAKKCEEEDIMFLLEDSDEAVRLPILNSTAPEEEKDKLARKLDSLMCLVFSFIDRIIAGEESVDFQMVKHENTLRREKSADRVYTVFSHFMSAFESTILLTHRSNVVQYLVFYLCGMWDTKLKKSSSTGAKLLSPLFARRAVEIILQPNFSMFVRTNAASYVGSLLGRAKFIDPSIVQTILTSLLIWAKGYVEVDTHERKKRVVTQESEHKLFYTVCQAVFYIISFNCQQISLWIQTELSLFRTVLCNGLRPLSKCMPSICIEFATILLKECYGMLPADLHILLVSYIRSCTLNRISQATIDIPEVLQLSSESETWEAEDTKGHVGIFADTYFPFNPYPLRKSSVYVEDIYKYWQSPPCSDASSTCSRSDMFDADSNESIADQDSSDQLEECSTRLASSYISDPMSLAGSPLPSNGSLLLSTPSDPHKLIRHDAPLTSTVESEAEEE